MGEGEKEQTTKVVSYGAKSKDFFSSVYLVVKEIPYGRVTSYGAIASYLSAKKSSRMVGWAMGASHSQKDIPAHRVVNRLGVLTGRLQFSDPTEMERKLVSEGIQIKDDKVVDFKMKFWDPSKALNL